MGVPERVGKDRHFGAADLIFRGQKVTPENRRDAENVKEIVVHAVRVDLFRFAITGHIQSGLIESASAFEGLGLLLNVFELGQGRWTTGFSLFAIAGGNADEPAGVVVRERTEQDRIDDRENCGVGTDPQGQGENRDDGKCRRFEQGPKRVAQVLPEGLHGVTFRWNARASGLSFWNGDAGRFFLRRQRAAPVFAPEDRN